MNATTYQKGEKVTYKKEIMFKGIEEVTATVVGVMGNTVLLDNGDQLSNLKF